MNEAPQKYSHYQHFKENKQRKVQLKLSQEDLEYFYNRDGRIFGTEQSKYIKYHNTTSFLDSLLQTGLDQPQLHEEELNSHLSLIQEHLVEAEKRLAAAQSEEERLKEEMEVTQLRMQASHIHERLNHLKLLT
jgi:hypothetical protein